MQGSGEFLDLGPAYDTFPSLGLDIDNVQAKAVLLDNPVNTFIPRSTYGLTGFLPGAPVSHANKQIHYETLKEFRGRLLDCFKKIICEILPQSQIGILEDFLRSV